MGSEMCIRDSHYRDKENQVIFEESHFLLRHPVRYENCEIVRCRNTGMSWWEGRGGVVGVSKVRIQGHQV